MNDLLCVSKISLDFPLVSSEDRNKTLLTSIVSLEPMPSACWEARAVNQTEGTASCKFTFPKNINYIIIRIVLTLR